MLWIWGMVPNLQCLMDNVYKYIKYKSMTKILRIEDFINESKGAPIHQRTPDRFTGDTLNKNTDKYLKMVDKFYLEDIFNMPNSFASKNVFQCYGDYNGKDYGVIVKIKNEKPDKPIKAYVNEPKNGYMYGFDIFGIAMSRERYYGLLESQKNALKHVFGADVTNFLDSAGMHGKGYDYMDDKDYVYLPITSDTIFERTFEKMLSYKIFKNNYVNSELQTEFYDYHGTCFLEFAIYVNTTKNVNLPNWDGWDGERTSFGITKEWKDSVNDCLSKMFSYISDTLNKKLVEILG